MARLSYVLSDQLADDLNRCGFLSAEGIKSLLVDGWSREIANRSLPIGLSELDKTLVKVLKVPSEKATKDST